MEPIGAGIVDQKQSGPTGIGGWLLVFVVVAALWAVLGAYGAIFPTRIPDIGPPRYSDPITRGTQFFFALVLAIDVFLILKRKKLARYISIAICGLLTATIAFDILFFISGMMQSDLATATQTARDFVLASLWLLYFMRSQRVQNTLVN